MNLFLFSCMALPLWAAIFALYFLLRRDRRTMRHSLIAKCAGSILAVSSAGLALCLRGENPLCHGIFWFFVLCTIADALLELQFVAGMLVFGAAHVCLLFWLWGIAPPTWWSLLFWAVPYGASAVLFRREIPKLGRLTIPFCLYPAVLSASLALAAPLPFTAGPALWPAAVGALCFFVSDMLVAKGELTGLDPKFHKLVMLLYWGALYLLAAPLWAA